MRSPQCTVALEGVAVPAGDVLEPVVVDIGRSSVAQEFEAAVCTFRLRNAYAHYGSTTWGSRVTVDVTYPDVGTFRRFEGTVTDRKVQYQADPDHETTMYVTAIGPFAQAARTVVGDVPWPEEVESARIGRILAAAGITPVYVDPGGITLISRDVDAQPAIALLRIAARSGGGMIVGTRTGIAYQDRAHRVQDTPRLTLGPAQVLVTPTIETSPIRANRVFLRYGPGDAAADRPHVEVIDQANRDRYGPVDALVQSDIRDEADALSIASYWLGRATVPAWVITSLPVELTLDTVDDALLAALLEVDLGDLIRVADLPSTGPVASGVLFLEGYREQFDWEGHRLELFVSDWALSNVSEQWQQVDAVLTWETVDPAVSWETWDMPPARAAA